MDEMVLIITSKIKKINLFNFKKRPGQNEILETLQNLPLSLNFTLKQQHGYGVIC